MNRAKLIFKQKLLHL